MVAASSDAVPTGRESAVTLRASLPLFRKPSVLPGFGLTLGFTLSYLGFIVLVPLAALIVKSSGLGWSGFWAAVTTPRVLAAFQVSFGLSFAAALTNAVFGFLVAWVLVRYDFPGKRLVDALETLVRGDRSADADAAMQAYRARAASERTQWQSELAANLIDLQQSFDSNASPEAMRQRLADFTRAMLAATDAPASAPPSASNRPSKE